MKSLKILKPFSQLYFAACVVQYLTYLQVADEMTELKLGNGTSILIAVNIASSLPASVGAAISQSASRDSSNLAIYALAFFLTTLGVVYVQDAERRIPMNYASRYKSDTLSGQAYLPFKVRLCNGSLFLH